MVSIESLEICGKKRHLKTPPQSLLEAWRQVLGVPGRPFRILPMGGCERSAMSCACLTKEGRKLLDGDLCHERRARPFRNPARMNR